MATGESFSAQETNDKRGRCQREKEKRKANFIGSCNEKVRLIAFQDDIGVSGFRYYGDHYVYTAFILHEQSYNHIKATDQMFNHLQSHQSFAPMAPVV